MPYLGGSDRSRSSDSGTSSTYSASDIAIVGLACRFAGDATDAEHFWELLCTGRSAYSETNRFNASAFHDRGIEKLNASVTRGGHFLSQDVAAFDANFFNISHNEALAIDPQQRLMLEVAYEAFENAGLPIESIAGTQTGCYVGNFTTDYREMLFRDPEAAPLYTVTGTGTSLISNRVSWFYDLKGPSFTVNTACSSSLVALHQACQSLRSGESSMTLVGGSNLILSPEMFMFFSNQKFLSRDGLCKSFDASGDGYSRGEGVAAIILKRVKDAIRDKDPIRAIIRGTGVNQDGMTKGITLPSAEAQAALISSTYRLAGLDVNDTQFFEAHGTGTKAGDPLELKAIFESMSTFRNPRDNLIVGSAKASIGHTEATAGLAGVIKGIYVLETGLIPPNIHFREPNPAIPFQKWKIVVPMKPTPWPTNGARRLSVNSFGYSGTNAHVILDDAFFYLKNKNMQGIHFTQQSTTVDTKRLSRMESQSRNALPNGRHITDPAGLKTLKNSRLFVLSSHDQDGLRRQKESLSRYFREPCLQGRVENDSDQTFYDLAFTLSERRSRLRWKSYIAASSIKELTAKLDDKKSALPVCRSIHVPRIGFIFTGQGAQWARMGIELFQYPIFRSSVDQADEYLRSNLGCTWSAIEEMRRDEATSRINLPTYSQPICTILQVALVDLLESWNIVPSAIAGHSSGEMAGAYCLGALSKEDAWKIAYHRGQLSSQINLHDPNLHGAMLAVGASASQTESWISQVSKGTVVVACVNSPMSVTVSGDVSGIDELHDILQRKDIFARKLKVDTAYHSHHMNVIAAPYLQAIHNVQPTSAREPRKMYSAVSGTLVEASELGPVNWVRNLVSPVLFSDAVSELLCPISPEERKVEKAVDVLLEIGPHAALQGPVAQIMKEHGITGIDYRSCLTRGHNAIETTLATVGALFALGVGVDIAKVNTDADNGLRETPRPLVDLPSYSWNHSRTYWGESRTSKEYRLREYPQLSLLGAPYPNMGENEHMWRGFLRISEEQWIRDHQIQGSILYPAAGYLAMAIEAARQIAEKGRLIRQFCLRDIQIPAAAVVTEETDMECIFQLRPHHIATRDRSATWLAFTVSTCGDGQTLRQNCSGLLLIEYEAEKGSAISLERAFENQVDKNEYHAAEDFCKFTEEPQEFYQRLAALGLMYGSAFQKVSRIRTGSGKSCCSVEAFQPEGYPSRERPHVIHPATLDAMFHTVFAAFEGLTGRMKEAMVPKLIDEVVIAANTPFESGSRFVGVSHATRHGFRELIGSLVMLDESMMQTCVTVKGFCCSAVAGMSAPDDESANLEANSFCQKLVWTPSPQLLTTEQECQLVNAVASGHLSPESAEKVQRLELMASIFVRQAVNDVQPDMIHAEPLKLLYKYMVEQLALTSENGHSLRSIPEDWHSINDEKAAAIEKEVEAEGADGATLCEVGRNLVEILCGKLDPVQLLANKTESGRGFAGFCGIDRSLKTISKLVNLMANSKPGLSILELGTASGEVASTVLSSLSHYLDGVTRPVDYTFTCSNELALQMAAEGKAFQELKSSVNFRVLDIEQDLAEQAFDSGTYDLVIVSNACAAVRDLDRALSNIEKLLKSNGKMCDLKITGPGLIFTSVLGSLLHGLRVDVQGTFHSPWNDKAWKALLEKKFNVDFVSRGFEDSRYRQLSLTVSTLKDAPISPTDDNEVVIVKPPAMSAQAKALCVKLVSKLERHFKTVKQVLWDVGSFSFEGMKCISLLELENPVLARLSAIDFAAIKKLILQSSSLLAVCSNDPSGSLAVGMARSIRNEIPDKQFRTLTVQAESLDSPDILASAIARLATIPVDDNEFVVQDGVLKVARVVKDESTNKQIASSLSRNKEFIELMPLKLADGSQKLAIQNQGMLDTLCYEKDNLVTQEIAQNEIEIQVKATGLNFRDIMVAMGNIPDSLFGFEASGIVTCVGSNVTKFKAGDHVCTLGHGAHRSVFRNNAAFVQFIPKGMSFEEAATLPLVHCTAYNALVRIAHAEAGQTVLVHAAAGGVGQAALQIAKHIGMEIFATVGSLDKRRLIQEVYGIPEDHIFASRDVSFAKGVMRMTHGRGVDVVLNSLSGELLRQTWHCIAANGTFIEIGLKDILSNTGLDMQPFSQNATFAFFNLSKVLKESPKLMAQIMDGTFDILRRGITKPILPLTIYPISQVEDAFRLMQTGKHRGKIALSWNEDEVVPVVRAVDSSLSLDSDATYVLVGGFGGLGRSLANLFVDHGARHLCFISRSGATSSQAQELIQSLCARHVVVKAYHCDIADEANLTEIMQRCAVELPRIRGVVQCAMVLRDVLFENMSYQDWTEAIRPKVDGSWYLHTLLPRDLDFFIVLSSFAGIFGNRTQSNYAAAGAFEDALAHHRRGRGLRAVTIDLGIMRDVGVIAERGVTDYLKEWEKPFGLTEVQLHALIKMTIKGEQKDPGKIPPQILTGFFTGGAAHAAGIRRPYFFDDPKFAIMAKTGEAERDGNTASGNKIVSVQEQMAHVTSLPDAVSLVTNALVTKVAKSLQTSTAEIDPGRALHSYGVDSLVAIEMRNWMFRDFKSNVSLFDVLSAVPICVLAEKIALNSKMLPDGIAHL
ncbi:hypothetical protein MMC11_007034 [Xylographa trunciseda]|nr:hypothetical protein [Xylographa trunciseda]